MANQDPSYNRTGSHNQVFAAPGLTHFNVVPSDSTILTGVRALVVGGAGTVIVTDIEGTDATYTAVAGQTIQFAAVKVKAATSATGIVAQR